MNNITPRDKIFAAIKAQCEQSKGPVTVSGTLLRIQVQPGFAFTPNWVDHEAEKYGLLVVGMSPVKNTIIFNLLQKSN